MSRARKSTSPPSPSVAPSPRKALADATKHRSRDPTTCVGVSHRLVEDDGDRQPRLLDRHEADERRGVMSVGVLAGRRIDLLRSSRLTGDAKAWNRSLDAGSFALG